ncbi:MAG: hypothetical protein GXP55_25360 [Deltaproteobacteria bacterium]|nr:hypothetical protein [Deltaproteobacteria bacterium]
MPTSAFVTHSTITDSGGGGVLRGWKGDAVDFTPTNTFARIAHCDQSDPRAADGSCTGEPLTYACADTP